MNLYDTEFFKNWQNQGNTNQGITSQGIPDFQNYYNMNLGNQPFPHTGMQIPDVQPPGIEQSNVAQTQNKGFNFPGITGMFLNALNFRNPLSERSSNYNPALAGQIEDLNKVNFLGTQSSPYQIAGGPLAGKNLVSMFGTNDYDQMLADKKAWFEKRIADKKDIGESKYKDLLDEITAREAEKKARDDAAAATRTRPQHHGDISRGGGHQAPNIRSISDQGPGVTASSGMHGGRHYAYGGRVGYNRGGRVGILAAF